MINSIDLIIKTYSFIFPKSFMKKWYNLGLTLKDRNEMKYHIIDYIAQSPDNNYGMGLPGNRLKHTGGAIKMRFSPESSNKGKSGSDRIIYFLAVHNNIAFITVYGKKNKSSLTNKENKIIHKFINYFNYKLSKKL